MNDRNCGSPPVLIKSSDVIGRVGSEYTPQIDETTKNNQIYTCSIGPSRHGVDGIIRGSDNQL